MTAQTIRIKDASGHKREISARRPLSVESGRLIETVERYGFFVVVLLALIMLAIVFVRW